MRGDAAVSRSVPARLTVVIPARDAERWIGEQLSALCEQEVDGEWEVILADNRSRDGTVRAFEQFADRLPSARVVDASSVAGQAYARNVAAAAARGDALVFLDADDVVSPGYLRAVRSGLVHCDVGVARIDYRRLNSSETGLDPPESPSDMAPYLGFLPAGPGAGLAVWRQVFDRLGGFDVDMPPGEDIDFCWRAQLQGFVIASISGAVLSYRMRSGVRRQFQQAFRYGEVHPALYRRFRQSGMPRRSGLEALRFHGGLFPKLLRVRSRSDLSAVAVMAGLRLGHIAGSARARAWYP